jgi:phosphatidylglycerol lysyltransferase
MEIASHAQPTLARTRDLVHRYGYNAMACQILNPGIQHWHSATCEAAIGYVPAAGYRIVAGAPLCDLAQLPQVVAEFAADAQRARQRVCYFGVGDRFLIALNTPPQTRMLLGAQPIWNPAGWPALLTRSPRLRSQINRLRPRLTVEIWEAARARASADLARCWREWLARRALPPMRFVVETDVLDQLEGRRVYVAEQGGRPVAFLIVVPVPGRAGWLIDPMIRGADAPNGAIELLIDAAMGDLRAAGAAWVSLGLSPLSQRAGLSYAEHPAWLRTSLGLVRRWGAPLYSFDGLDAFKARLDPDAWEPLYAVAPHGLSPRTLYAIAAAFSDDNPARFVLRGYLRRLRR